jgi:hypothetical protein
MADDIEIRFTRIITATDGTHALVEAQGTGSSAMTGDELDDLARKVAVAAGLELRDLRPKARKAT